MLCLHAQWNASVDVLLPSPFLSHLVDPPNQTILIHLHFDGYWGYPLSV
jgi:hypothetical protein